MSSPPDPTPTLSKQHLFAWLGGGALVFLAASLAFFPLPFSLGVSLWQVLGSTPEMKILPLPNFLASAGIGLTSVWIALRIPQTRRVFSLLGVAALLILSQSVVLALYHQAWEPLPALLALWVGGTMARWLRPAHSSPDTLFRGRLSRAALTTLNKAKDLSFLRPDQRMATVLTCRLLNENTLRERLPARDFLKLCETFRCRAASLLLAHGACLDPAEPNGVRAFFGLPLTSAAPADDSIRAALALDESLLALFAAQTLDPATMPQCGIGLATGILTAGVTGATYTVLGDAVELSRWLALQNNNYQTRLLLDSATHLAADEIEDRPLEFINPPEGAAVEIFQLLGTVGSLSCEALARCHAFRDAIMLLRAGHAEDAVRRFNEAQTGLVNADPVLGYFISLAVDQARRDAASTGPSAATSPPTPSGISAGVPRRANKSSRKLPRRP